MVRIYTFDSWLAEGVFKAADGFTFDWAGQSAEDIMSLNLKPYRGRTLHVKDSNCVYCNYYAYNISKSEHSLDLLTSIKKLETTISPNDIKLLVNKAVLAFDRQFDISTFNAIISIESTSKVLQEVNQQMLKKSAVAMLFDDAFVKNAGTEVTVDMEAYEKLPPQSKKKIDQSLKLAQNPEKGFKMKSIAPQFRSFFHDFIKFNKESDRRLFNAVHGQRVIVVDDYKTSGTTIAEMVKQLADAGAAEIVVFVLIRLN